MDSWVSRAFSPFGLLRRAAKSGTYEVLGFLLLGPNSKVTFLLASKTVTYRISSVSPGTMTHEKAPIRETIFPRRSPVRKAIFPHHKDKLTSEEILQEH